MVNKKQVHSISTILLAGLTLTMDFCPIQITDTLRYGGESVYDILLRNFFF